MCDIRLEKEEIESQQLELYDIDKVDEKIFRLRDCIDFLENGFFCFRFNIIWGGIITGILSQMIIKYVNNIYIRDIIAVIFILFILLVRRAIFLLLLFKSRVTAYKKYSYDFSDFQIVKFSDTLKDVEKEKITFNLIQFSNEEVTVRLDYEKGRDYIILVALNSKKKYLMAYAPIEEYNKVRRKAKRKIKRIGKT